VIRCFHVTGVQTCALPIVMSGSGIHKVLWCTTPIDLARSEFDIISSKLEKGYASITVRMHPNFDIKEELREFIPERLYTSLRWRSEERRVGKKDNRSGWAL